MSARDDERHFWTALTDMAERRIRLVLAAHDATPIYDPQLGSGGAGWPCSRCRLINQSDARVCSSCGLILKMTP